MTIARRGGISREIEKRKLANMDRRKSNELKKEYLRGYQQALRREKFILEEINRLRARQTSVSVEYDGMPHDGGVSDLSDYVVALDSQIEKLYRAQLETVQRYQEISGAVEQVPDDKERELLQLRYLMGKRWEDVAELMGYVKRQVLRIHGDALLHFEIPAKEK